MSSLAIGDPFLILGLSRDAGEDEVRARYLRLVKQYPPEREPAKFREIRAAYDAAKDPYTIAKRLVAPPSTEPPSWTETLKAQKTNPPRMPPAFVLSLGNRAIEQPALAPESSPSVDSMNSNATDDAIEAISPT